MNALARCGRRWSRWLWFSSSRPRPRRGRSLTAKPRRRRSSWPRDDRAALGAGRRQPHRRRRAGVYAPRACRDGGWAESDIEIVPVDDTAYLIATWPGSDPSLGPVVISAHMDVVEARPEDWERDPFTPVVENGYLYGRGASDTKFEASLAVASLIELRRQGFRPRRSIVVAYSGDEETTMKTSKLIAERLKHAHWCSTSTAPRARCRKRPASRSTGPGRAPRRPTSTSSSRSPIPAGTARRRAPTTRSPSSRRRSGASAAYRFTPEINDITRAYFEQGRGDPARSASSPRRCAPSPPTRPTRQAIEVLRADPAMNGGDRHDLRADDGLGRPRAQRAAAARDRDRQLPGLPRPLAAPRSRPSSSASRRRPR